MSRRAAIWALGALLGIVVTAAITWATSRLAGQHIGLSSEPLSAGRSLAPRAASEPAPIRGTTTTTTVTRTKAVLGPVGVSPSSTTTTAVVTQTRSTRSVEVATSSSRHARDDGGSRGEGGAAGGGPEGGEGRGSGGRGPDD